MRSLSLLSTHPCLILYADSHGSLHHRQVSLSAFCIAFSQLSIFEIGLSRGEAEHTPQTGGVWLRALFSLSQLYVLCLALTSDFTLKKVVKSRTEYMFAWLRAVVLQLVQNLLEFLIDTMSSDVIARKLQGVYDCIDARNFKGAIKLCQRKDIQNYDITKALMSYCFISMQRTEEGLVIAREIKV